MNKKLTLILTLFSIFTLVSCDKKETNKILARSNFEDYLVNKIEKKKDITEEEFNKAFNENKEKELSSARLFFKQGIKLSILSNTKNEEGKDIKFDFTQITYFGFLGDSNKDDFYSYQENISQISDKSTNNPGEEISGTFEENYLNKEDKTLITNTYKNEEFKTQTINNEQSISSYQNGLSNMINNSINNNRATTDFINNIKDKTYFISKKDKISLKGTVQFTYQQIIFDCNVTCSFNDKNVITNLIYDGTYESKESENTYDMHCKLLLNQVIEVDGNIDKTIKIKE